jgi:hypothetical protein
MKLTDKQLLILLGAGALAFLYLKSKAGEALDAVNPVNPNNVIYGGVNAVGGALSGNDDFSLGSWFYDVVHNEE